MGQRGLGYKIWAVVYPLLFYYAVMLITMAIAQSLIGADHAHYVVCQLISTVVTIPAVLPLYRQDQALRGIAKGGFGVTGDQVRCVSLVMVIVFLWSFAANNLISMTPLVELSEGYREASAGFYGSTLALELVSSGFATPLLEELVFRGIIFARLREMLPKYAAVLLSALLFAIMHFNIVQFLYAFVIGAVLALLMDKAGHMYAAVAGHITANVIAVLRTETGILAWSADKSPLAWVSSAAALLAGAGILVWYLRTNADGSDEKDCFGGKKG